MKTDTALSLEYVCTYRARLKPPVAIGSGPFGQRMFFEVIDGEIEAPGVKGAVLSGGGDWLLLGDDGWGRLDVRAQLRMDGGGTLYADYHGYIEWNDAVQAWLANDTATDWGDQYFRTAPRFETGDENWAWMTHTVFIAEGRLQPNRTVEYQLYRAT